MGYGLAGLEEKYLDHAIRTRRGQARIDPRYEWQPKEEGPGWRLYGVALSRWYFEWKVWDDDGEAGERGEYRLHEPNGDLYATRPTNHLDEAPDAQPSALRELRARDQGRRQGPHGFFGPDDKKT